MHYHDNNANGISGGDAVVPAIAGRGAIGTICGGGVDVVYQTGVSNSAQSENFIMGAGPTKAPVVKDTTAGLL